MALLGMFQGRQSNPSLHWTVLQLNVVLHGTRVPVHAHYTLCHWWQSMLVCAGDARGPPSLPLGTLDPHTTPRSIIGSPCRM